jgi:vitamin B12 transporter
MGSLEGFRHSPELRQASAAPATVVITAIADITSPEPATGYLLDVAEGYVGAGCRTRAIFFLLPPSLFRLDAFFHANEDLIMYRRKTRYSATMPLAFAVCGAGAALDCSATNPPTLNTVVVTATRTERSAASTLAANTVITQQDIQRQQPHDVIELLKTVPGVDAIQRGGLGGESSVFMRGTNANHMLLLIDGQRVGSATLGSASLQYLDPNQIERIEIVRGPLSSLYGSDAIGGVVQIFTKKNNPARPVSLHAGYGSNETRNYAASASVAIAGWVSNAGLSYLDTDGYNRTFSDIPGSEDEDAYRSATVNIGTRRQFGAHEINFHYLRNEAETEYDAIDSCYNASGICQPFSSIVNEVGSVGGTYAVNTAFRLKSNIGVSKDKTTTEDDANAATDDAFTTWRDSFLLQGDWQLDTNALLSAGFDYTRDRVRGAIAVSFDPVTRKPTAFSNYNDTSRGNRAWFAQLQNRIGIADLVFGFRNDDNDAFGRKSTGNVSIGIDAGETTRVVFASGSAFHAPSFNDLYWPDPYGPGNPDLVPEQSTSNELRVEHRRGEASYSAAIYQTEISDLIQWQPIDPGDEFSPWRPINIAEAEIQGAELTTTQAISDFAISASYSYTRPLDTETDNQLINRTRHKFAVSADRRFGAFAIGIDATVFGKRYMDQENLVSAGGYGLVDLRMSYDMSDDLTTSLKIRNLLDRDYVVIDRYREDGINATLSVEYKL